MTIARWYYTVRRVRDDPVGAFRRAVRKDCGKVSLAAALAERLHFQYRDHPHWSYQLHYDNLWIADDYNQRIANIENSKEPAPIKAAEIEKLIAEANGFAAHKAGAAVATIMEATQRS